MHVKHRYISSGCTVWNLIGIITLTIKYSFDID